MKPSLSVDRRMRYQKIWTEEEDANLRELVEINGARRWNFIALQLSSKIGSLRQGKQCRERWINYLSPENSKISWSDEEIQRVFKLQLKYGNSWSKISDRMKGRSQNAIKNLFYSTIRRNLRRFNKGRPENERIKGSLFDLIQIEEIRKILTMSVQTSKEKLARMRLSAESLAKMSDMGTVIEEDMDKSESDEEEINEIEVKREEAMEESAQMPMMFYPGDFMNDFCITYGYLVNFWSYH